MVELTAIDARADDHLEGASGLLKKQRSHLLLVLSNHKDEAKAAFLEWYQGPYDDALRGVPGVLYAQCYEQHDVDITRGRYPRIPFNYLGIYEISTDGAQEAERLIERVMTLHRQQAAAEPPATWLYYAVGEKVGRSPRTTPSMVTIAFANAVSGQDAEFREWYVTRHIRHALSIPALVSGQCFERCNFQRPGALDAIFSMIAIYEQEGTPKDIIDGIASLPKGTCQFPMLDVSRFSEWTYKPL